MTRSRRERISDILDAIERCSDYRDAMDATSGPVGRMAYDAVLHNLMLIGEAANSIREDLSTALPGTPWHSIIGLRNIVAHEYFRVRPDLIADIVDNDLRSLAIGLRRLLDD